MIGIGVTNNQNSSQTLAAFLPGDATKGQNLCEIASPGGIALAVDRAQLPSFVKAGNGVSADIEHPALRVEFGSPLGVGTTRPDLGGIEGVPSRRGARTRGRIRDPRAGEHSR